MRLSLLLAAALAFAACNDDTAARQPPRCVDNDHDGFDSCADCNDADATVHPGAVEICGDAVDNDCDARTDEGCATAGSDAGSPGPDAGTTDCPGVDTQNDPDHCGSCTTACPTPKNAARLCRAGVCGRSACNAGTFDFDGAKTFGCEASCTGKTCTDGSGATLTLDAPPVAESSASFAFGGGASFGSGVQTGGRFTNEATVGEAGIPASAAQSGGRFRHVGGFSSTLEKK